MTGRLSTTDWAVLSALLEGASHGFRLAVLFSREGELGDIWRIQRPQVYRALEHLRVRGLVQEVGREEGGGPPRTVFALTEAGRRAALGWLYTPVERLRYGRSDLRLKLAFLLRLSLDPTPLLQAQQELFTQILAGLEVRLPEAQGLERLSVLWRLQMARASLDFIAQMMVEGERSPP
ncbi:MAG: PadR family transcriptional regulator [Meiothermus sp.]|uniref:PadR family transcriptional regulator n=1 Tax=Meiothermus sp. TaxID=1955249 RepID=UPI0025D25D15|nr:PadR family transcriptional regulator [Meiothermus sp.]MCS7058218.1 PadR family transcriptional regulator [Meiothermus sp.]MCS7194729.1 PadR family transcriptional regulator [Meiothermus sp.]MCX7739478.1 PadR family transcriptional regulator [Meiothermus sp.]MDW8091418.1 PadR family transcriptional regulator [Meiothermus sp.]MDW8481348.1 PadR family transcriptional regulator [Meiothermus sp.]